MSKPKPLPIKSSWLKGATYDAKTKRLTVQMGSGTYEYADVPPEIYDSFAKTFQSSESSGKYLNEHLRQFYSKKAKG
jgi:hypothetical protein